MFILVAPVRDAWFCKFHHDEAQLSPDVPPTLVWWHPVPVPHDSQALAPWGSQLLTGPLVPGPHLRLWAPSLPQALGSAQGHVFGSREVCSFQLLSRVQLFMTPWTIARQASLSITNSRSLLKLLPIKSVRPSSVVPFSSHLQSFPASGDVCM